MPHGHKDQLTLGGLIDALKAAPTNAMVRFDFGGCWPDAVESWRGAFEDLALGWAVPPRPAHATASWLLKLLESALGTEFEGYKGGTYTMTRETPVWVDVWGRCSNTALVGVNVEPLPAPAGGYVTLLTAYAGIF